MKFFELPIRGGCLVLPMNMPSWMVLRLCDRFNDGIGFAEFQAQQAAYWKAELFGDLEVERFAIVEPPPKKPVRWRRH